MIWIYALCYDSRWDCIFQTHSCKRKQYFHIICSFNTTENCCCYTWTIQTSITELPTIKFTNKTKTCKIIANMQPCCEYMYSVMIITEILNSKHIIANKLRLSTKFTIFNTQNTRCCYTWRLQTSITKICKFLSTNITETTKLIANIQQCRACMYFFVMTPN